MTTAQIIAWLAFFSFGCFMGLLAIWLYERDKA